MVLLSTDVRFQMGTVGQGAGIEQGGCSGYDYVYDFAKKIRPQKDLVFDFDGLTVVVDNRSIEFLKGAVLD